MRKKRTLWAMAVAVVAFLGATFTFVSNAGHARDAVCSFPAVAQACVHYGLVDVRAVAREALLQRVAGVWGSEAHDGAPACATQFAYSVSRREGEDYITLRGPGYESTGRVASAEGQSIFTRTVTPAAEAGAQWELKLEADRLLAIDSVGTPTPLVRCGS